LGSSYGQRAIEDARSGGGVPEVERVGTGHASGGRSCAGGAGVGQQQEPVSAKTLANRAKRHAARDKRNAKKAGTWVAPDLGGSSGSASEGVIPEWRRQTPKAPFHRSAFADCSEQTRVQLRESRASMLLQRNEVAKLEAECNRRRLEAKLKCQMIEKEVETARLKAEAETKRLIDLKMSFLPAGFAETVVSAGLESVFTVPQSLSSGSISPNSSISVDMVVRMERTLQKLATENEELRSKLSGKAVPVATSVAEKKAAVVATIARLERASSPVKRVVPTRGAESVVKTATGVTFGESCDSAAQAIRSASKRQPVVDVANNESDDSVEAVAARLEADSYENSGATFSTMPKEEYDYRRLNGLPVVGPGSGLKGYGRWD